MLAPRNVNWIAKLLPVKAKKFGVELKEFVNMGDHIHFEIRILNRRCFQNFLRSITSLIARHVTGARKGVRFGRFWEGLAFTRVVETSFEEWKLREYFIANRVERQHGYEAREKYLRGRRAPSKEE